MIDADIRGKLSADGSNAHDRAEDLLTSTVFGLLRYLPPNASLIPLLRLARRCDLHAGDTLRVEHDPASNAAWMGLGNAESVQICFWPAFGVEGEPDLLLTFLDADGKPIHLVVVEVKLHSPKSGNAEIDADTGADATTVLGSDQLLRYWRGLFGRSEADATVARTLVYLTAHATPPATELRDSLIAARGQRLPLAQPMRLGWLSWHDVWQIVSVIAGGAAAPLAATDLARLLAHRGFRQFDGYHGEAPQIPASGRFWTASVWFESALSAPLPKHGAFWS